MIVDPGSYVYTPDPEARNLFRSTRYHNTLSIDDEEQNDMRPEWLFRLFETAHAEHRHYHADETAFEYHGRHIGYERLSKGKVTHERRFRLLHGSRMLIISDLLDARGTHHLCWHFHLAPGITSAITQTGICQIETMGKSYILASLDGLEMQLNDAWYSPAYGVRLHCRALNFVQHAPIDGRLSRGFAVAPVLLFDLQAAKNAYASLQTAFD